MKVEPRRWWKPYHDHILWRVRDGRKHAGRRLLFGRGGVTLAVGLDPGSYMHAADAHGGRLQLGDNARISGVHLVRFGDGPALIARGGTGAKVECVIVESVGGGTPEATT